MAISVDTTTAPKIDRRAILKSAWAQCKGWYERRGRAFKFVKSEFQWALRCAWHDARLAMMTATERHIDSIKRQIAHLAFKPFRIDIEAQRRALEAELATLTA